MESFLFGFCLIAVIWLIVWVECDAKTLAKHWWPFDMRGFVAPKAPPPAASWRANARQQRGRH